MVKIIKKNIYEMLLRETSMSKIIDSRLLSCIFIYWKITSIALFILLFIYMDAIDVSQYYYELFESHRINYNFWLSIVNLSLILSLYAKLKSSSIDIDKLNFDLEHQISNYLMGGVKYIPFYFWTINDYIYLDKYIFAKLCSRIRKYEKTINNYYIWNAFISPWKNKNLLNSLTENQNNFIRNCNQNIYILRDGKKHRLGEVKIYKLKEQVDENNYVSMSGIMDKTSFGGSAEYLEMIMERQIKDNDEEFLPLNLVFDTDEYEMFIKILNLIHKKIEV